MICIIDTYAENKIRGIFTSVEEAMKGLKSIATEDLESHILPKQQISHCYKIVDVKVNSTTNEWDKVFPIDWDKLFREISEEDRNKILEDDLIDDPVEIILDVNVWLDYEDAPNLSRKEEETIVKLFKEYPIFRTVCSAMYDAGKLGF